MKTTLLLAAVALVAGCASSSGVHSTDADTYAVTVEASNGKGGILAAHRIAYEEAAKYCAPRVVQRVKEFDHDMSWNETTHRMSLDFKCVRPEASADTLFEKMVKAAPPACSDMNAEARAALRCTP